MLEYNISVIIRINVTGMNKYFLKWWLTIPVFLIFFANYKDSLASSGYNPLYRFYYGVYVGVDLRIKNQYEVSPFLGYQITPWWQAGLGAKYQYHYDKRIGSVFKSHIYGPLIFTDLIAIKNLNDILPFRFIDGALYIHAEMNLFSLPTSHFDIKNEHPDKKRFFQPTWLTGIGLRRELGNKSYFNLLLMLDVSGDSGLIYSNPIIRFGLIF